VLYFEYFEGPTAPKIRGSGSRHKLEANVLRAVKLRTN